MEQSGRNDEARRAYENAVHESPDLAEAYLRLGILTYRAGDLPKAAHFFGQVEQNAPNSEMADEARTYLDKINTPAPLKARFHTRSSRIRHREIENLQPLHKNEPATPPAQHDMMNSPHASVQRRPAGETEAPAAGKPAAPGNYVAPDHQPNSYRYTVRIGPFADRTRAEEMKSSLRGKGYSAVVIKLRRHAHGKAFVIELQPVDSISKATTLMTQLSGEIEGIRPMIIKVPAQ